MNSKGQMVVGGILIAFVAILVGLILYQAIVPTIGTITGINTVTVTNSTITVPAVGSTLDLTGQELVGTPVLINYSTGDVIPTTNYSMSEGIGSDGLKGVIFKHTGAGEFLGANANLSYQYIPDGYIDNGGGRSMALLIPIFLALAIAVIALVPSLRSGIIDLVK